MLTFGQKITSGLLGSLKILLLCGLSNGADWNPMYNTKISLQISHYFSWFLPRFIMISLKFLLPFLSFQWDRLEPCTIQRYFSRFLKISHDFFPDFSPDFSWFLSSFFSFFLSFQWDRLEPCTLQRFLSILFNISHDFFPDFSPDFSRFLKVFSHLFSFPVGQVWTQVQYKNWEKTWSILSSKEDLLKITSHKYNTKIEGKLGQFDHHKKIYR